MELKQAVEGNDLADIRAKTEALQEASHKLAEAVYQQAATQQAHATPSDGAGAEADEEVIEEAEIVDEEAPTT
jgi:molecular chaperone DnaK